MRAVARARPLARQLLATLLVVALVALLAGLGTWQLGRAREKNAQAHAFEASAAAAVALPAESAPPRYLHVALEGHYVPAHQVLLDNMTHAGQVGYRVLTPFATVDGATVLVDRGWVPLGRTRADLPDVGVGAHDTRLAGRIDELPRAGIDLEAPVGSGWPRVLSYPGRSMLESVLGVPLYPRIVLLDAGEPDGYLRDWQPTGLSGDRHVAYAVQWYALAVTLGVLYLIARLRSRGTPP